MEQHVLLLHSSSVPVPGLRVLSVCGVYNGVHVGFVQVLQFSSPTKNMAVGTLDSP